MPQRADPVRVTFGTSSCCIAKYIEPHRLTWRPTGSARLMRTIFGVPTMENSLSFPTLVFLIWLGTLATVLFRFG